MANAVTGFWQTVLSAMTEASETLVFPTKAIESIYMDYKPEAATIGQTLNVVIPDITTNDVVDIGVGDISGTDATETTVPIVMSHHPAQVKVFRDFEQFNTPGNLRERFVDACMKGMMEYMNAQVTGLITTGNFPTNAAIATTAHIVTTTQFLNGMAILSDARVPVQNDPENMSLLVPSLPYTAILGDSNWTQAQIAGMPTAITVRGTGVMPTAYGCTVKLDPQMPTTGTVGARTFTAAYMHKYAIAMVTRPIAAPDSNVVECSYFNFKGVPFRVMLGYNQLPKMAYVLTIDAGFGLKVVRDSMAQLYTIAE